MRRRIDTLEIFFQQQEQLPAIGGIHIVFVSYFFSGCPFSGDEAGHIHGDLTICKSCRQSITLRATFCSACINVSLPNSVFSSRYPIFAELIYFRTGEADTNRVSFYTDLPLISFFFFPPMVLLNYNSLPHLNKY